MMTSSFIIMSFYRKRRARLYRPYRRPRYSRVKGSRAFSARGRAAIFRRRRLAVRPNRQLRWYKSKKMTKSRNRVGLPKLELKRHYLAHTLIPATNWTAFNATTFMNGTTYHLDKVAIGATNSTREARTVKFLKGKCQLCIKQAADTQYWYRIMIIQVFDMGAQIPDPNEILEETGTASAAMVSNYLVAGARGEGVHHYSQLKVHYDKFVRFNTDDGGQLIRNYKIRTPAHTVTFEAGDDTGETGAGKVYLCVVSDTQTANAAYQHHVGYDVKFIDQ